MITRSKNSTAPLFEEDYLIRDIGILANDSAAALTELVANAFDAGASVVNIIIPTTKQGTLAIIDDGHGMTSQQFHDRWMKMGYNRIKHQGPYVEFPKSRQNLNIKRRAYGRNGIGRHSLLCFADEYMVETWHGGKGIRFVISTAEEEVPFRIQQEVKLDGNGAGTKLSVLVERNLPDPDKVRGILSARFLHDPQFEVKVNGESIALAELTGLIEQQELRISDTASAEAYVIDTTMTASSTRYQGIAIWVSNRLVGAPSWIVGNTVLLDGRSRFAKRYSIIVKTDNFPHENIEQDWSRFKNTADTQSLYSAVSEYVKTVIENLSSSLVREVSEDALVRNRDDFERLSTLARIEVAQFTEELVKRTPSIQSDVLALAVQAVINLEKTRNGASLLEKLTKLGDEDVTGLDRLLSEWSVRDACSVLDEIDRRLEVIAAIEKLSGDPNADEVHTLHPLITQARWVFGPEFDSPEYSSNISLKNAVEKIFGQETESQAFANHLRRPDLMIRAESTFSVVATDEIDTQESGLTRIRDVLIIELKRGGFTVTRKEMDQATGYIEDILSCGLIDGAPAIRAFVVGHKLDPKMQTKRTVGNDKDASVVQAVTFGQLVRTANKRLFRLKEKIPTKYEQLTGNELAAKILQLPKQAALLQQNG
jgi:hypothetical protein